MPENVEMLNFFKPSGVPYALLILVIAFVAVRISNRSFNRLGDRFSDRRLLIQQASSLVRFGIYLLSGIAATATVVSLSREVVLALGGTLAVAIGFSLRDIAASFIAGIVILVDKPFQVGDRVTFDGHYGEIQSIGLRSVRLVTLDDTLVTIPNSKFLTDSVASGNAGQVSMMIQIDFFVSPDQDVAQAKRIVEEALTTSRYVHLKKKWTVLVNQVIHENYFAVRLRAKAYVLDVRFEKQFETDVTERAIAGFHDAGIKPPAVLHREARQTSNGRTEPWQETRV